MSGSYNSVTLIGNLGADPEIKSFANGGRVANLRVATSETWKEKGSGERKERTDWHTVVIQNDGLVGIVEKYLKKGSKALFVGQLRTRKWQDSSGADRYSTEVVIGFGGVLVMLDGAPKGEAKQDGDGWVTQTYGAQTGGSLADDLDDDIGF